MHGMASGSVLATVVRMLPEGLDSEEAQWVILALLAVCVVATIMVLRTVQKSAIRILAIIVLIVVGGALWLQREDLRDCQGGCTCHLFGQDLEVRDPDAFCPEFDG